MTLETSPVSPAEDEQQADQQAELERSMRSVRAASRDATPDGRSKPAGQENDAGPVAPLPELSSAPSRDASPPPSSPGRDDLNELWDLSAADHEAPQGLLSRLLSLVRGPLNRLVRFAVGPVIERQVRMNSAQVRFDNEFVQYVDARLDRMSQHYDGVLGQHGKRMEEIDERHLILQQELVRHVHDLIERIEFVFENAETNHLYVDGMLRETREELERLVERLEALAQSGQD